MTNQQHIRKVYRQHRIPAFAQGGCVPQPALALVGEKTAPERGSERQSDRVGEGEDERAESEQSR